MLRFDRAQLTADLRDIAPAGQLAFAAATAQRLHPGYVKYCEETGHDGAAPLRHALECVWREVEAPSTGRDDLRRQHEIAHALTDVPETPFSEYVICAQDATAAVTYCLRFLLGDDEEGAVRAADCACGAAYQYAVLSMVEGVQIATAADVETWLSHEFVQTELTRQRRDILELRSAKSEGLVKAAANLRARAEQESVIPTRLL